MTFGSMKMRQYIAITDHILWDIITNGDQATTDPASSSAPKTSLAANARRNNEKALNILLSAIPDRHLLSFHDATNGKTLWTAIKARFGGNEASKKMQKDLLDNLDGELEFDDLLNYLKVCYRKKLIFDGSGYDTARRTEQMVVMKEECDAETSDIAYDGLTEVEQDDWSMEFDAEHMHFGQDGLGDFDWSNKADDTPVSLALMATNSEVPYCSKCSKSYKKLLESYQTERDNFQKARTEILGYQMSLESLEVILKTHEKNEYAWGDKYEQMEYDLKIRDLKLEEKQKELDQALKERDDFKEKLEKWSNAAVLQNEVLNKQRYLSDKSCIGFGVESSSGMDSENSSRNTNSSESSYPNFQKAKGFHSVPPPTGTIIPPRANVSFTGIDELAIRKRDLNQENTKSSQPEIDRIKAIQKKSQKTNAIIDSGCLWKQQKDEAVLWHRRLGHVNFKNINTVAKGNLVKVLPPRHSAEHSSLASRKGLVQKESRENIALQGRLQQNGVAERKDRTLIEDARTIKGFRVYNRVTRKVQDCLHVNFLENQENQKGKGPDWMFDLELLTPSMNYIPVRKENYADSRGQETACNDVEDLDDQQFIVHGPSINAVQNKHSEEHTADKEVPLSSDEQALHDELVSLMHQESLAKLHNDAQRNAFEKEKKRIALEKGKACVDSTFTLSTANTPSQSTGNTPTDSDDDVPKDGVFSKNSFDDENTDTEEGGAADYNNMDPTIDVTSTPTLRIHKIHPQSQIIGKSTAGILTRRKLKESASDQHQALLSFIYKQNRTNHKDQQTCLFACFLSQEEPKKVSQALADESWVEAMQEEALHSSSRMYGYYVIYQMASEFAQGIETKRKNIRYSSLLLLCVCTKLLELKHQTSFCICIFHGLTVYHYQMDVKSAFLYGNITEEVYVKQPPGFEDPAHPNKVYRVVKALYGLHQAPRAWYERLSTFLLKHGYRRGAIDKTLFIKKDRRDIMLVQVYVDDIIFGSTKSSMVKDFEELMQKEFKMSSMGELTFFLGLQVKQTSAGIFLSQDKYVKDILNKFDFRTIKPASTLIEAHKSLGKDEEGEDVDVHLYRSMIGCLMYLTASRPDIMFAVCLCARFQVTPKVSHLHAVKRIFRYLKHQPKLGLWYPKDSPFHLEAFSDSDYAGDNHDRRSTSGGCQYLGRRLVSWQCKKQTIVAISSTEAEYVAAASCCAQVLWMQNQLLDYGFNFMNTEIHIDNESTICIVKNPVLHSKTKHIQIRHHFIRDCYEQRLINVVKVHTDDNVADLLTKGFDLARFNFLVLQQFWATASLSSIHDVPHISAMVAGKRVLISEKTIRVDLLFDDADGVDCFP
ncbi:putative ribonuclease H-like domain-containing protein [Tanacetum coccineum]